jgi:hypothetical protein
VGEGANQPVGVGRVQGVGTVVGLDVGHSGQLGQRRGSQVHPADADSGGDVVDAAVGDDPAVGDHHHAGGQRLRLLQVVGSEQHGAAAGHKGLHGLPQPVSGLHVQAAGRLVHDHRLGAAGEGKRRCQPTLLAAGEAASPPTGHLRQAEPLKQL